MLIFRNDFCVVFLHEIVFCLNNLFSPSLRSNRTFQTFWALRPWRRVCVECGDLHTTISDPPSSLRNYGLRGQLDSDPVLAAGKIFDPRVWPESVEDLATYGEAEVECLVQHFRLASFGEEWFWLCSHSLKNWKFLQRQNQNKWTCAL